MVFKSYRNKLQGVFGSQLAGIIFHGFKRHGLNQKNLIKLYILNLIWDQFSIDSAVNKGLKYYMEIFICFMLINLPYRTSLFVHDFFIL